MLPLAACDGLLACSVEGAEVFRPLRLHAGWEGPRQDALLIMNDEESEGLAAGRTWLKAGLAAGRVGFCSFPTNPGWQTIGSCQNHLERQGRGPGRGEEMFFCPVKEPFVLSLHNSSCLRTPSLGHWL